MQGGTHKKYDIPLRSSRLGVKQGVSVAPLNVNISFQTFRRTFLGVTQKVGHTGGFRCFSKTVLQCMRSFESWRETNCFCGGVRSAGDDSTIGTLDWAHLHLPTPPTPRPPVSTCWPTRHKPDAADVLFSRVQKPESSTIQQDAGGSNRRSGVHHMPENNEARMPIGRYAEIQLNTIGLGVCR